ncbi:MAG: gliding motility protein GldM [Bacteroidota bacterium]
MSIPKEPRQIMINLMYLVLTALLALNVSNEILHAFKTLSLSIDSSNKSIEQSTNLVYEQIKENEKAAGQAEKVKPFREKADEVVKQSDEMVKYLNDWKKKIVMEAGGYDEHDPTMPEKQDNIDATTLLLVEKKGGDEMKARIEKLRAFMLQIIGAKEGDPVSKNMPLKITPAEKNDHNPQGDWSVENFEHMPAVAALALFSKFQNDVRSTQSQVIKQLFEEAHMKDIKFDTITAVAVPKTTYALDGDKIEASILLAAFNKANKPVVSGGGGGGSFKPAVNGIVQWETIAHGTGLQTVQGKITLETAEQGKIERPWKFEYMVGTTGASMQLDKMNVFYIGVENPVTVTAAGYSVQDVSLEVPDATVKGELGKYAITVTKPGKIQVKINAKTKEGPIKQVGTMDVRVKRIPDPIAKLSGKIGGLMPAGEFRIQIAPAAVLENFDFEARYKVVAFSFSMLPKGKDYQGPFPVENKTVGCRFSDNPNITRLMSTARAGDRIFIESIKAIGPDNTVRNLPPLLFTLN